MNKLLSIKSSPHGERICLLAVAEAILASYLTTITFQNQKRFCCGQGRGDDEIVLMAESFS
jgi:hypothetical protein